MTPHYTDHSVTLYHGDCLDILRGLPDNSVDAVVTDPPYGLEFMGKEWDSFRVDDPGTNRHRGSRAGKHGETIGAVDESLPSRPSGVLFDPTKRQARGVSYGGGKRPTTNVCEGCGKRDQFRNAHTCPDGTAWRSEILNPHAAPPTSLAFQAWCTEWSREAYRVLKPGGHMLTFGGTRTFHRLACAVEDAGFEIRDSIAWLYGSGFPKSLDVSKAIDKAAGAERTEAAGKGWHDSTRGGEGVTIGRFAEEYQPGDAAKGRDLLAPATDAARQWQGWGTALKPAFEPVVVARKPLIGTVAGNVQAWGTGALNVDACRINTTDDLNGGAYRKERPCTSPTAPNPPNNASTPGRTAAATSATKGPDPATSATAATATARETGRHDGRESWRYVEGGAGEYVAPSGRWPANVVLDESQAAALDQMSGELKTGAHMTHHVFRASENASMSGANYERSPRTDSPADSGGASRFFYTAKAELAADRVDAADDAGDIEYVAPSGRWPANVVLDESQAAALDQMSGEIAGQVGMSKTVGGHRFIVGDTETVQKFDHGVKDHGGASRFFLTARPDPLDGQPRFTYMAKAPTAERPRVNDVAHPTTKPLSLMRWLVRLVTPPGGVVLEPFAGSGTTVEACILEGFHCIAIEREADYLPLIVQRVNRQRDPIAYTTTAGEDLGLFGFEELA